MSERIVYRPALSQQEMGDIMAALENEYDRRVKAATKAKDPEQALAALMFKERASALADRFAAMVWFRSHPKTKDIPGQMTMDEEFDRKKAQAEAEERAERLLEHDVSEVWDSLPDPEAEAEEEAASASEDEEVA
jgi:hypothetical protein